MQVLRGVQSVNWQAVFAIKQALYQPRLHLHDANAGLCVPRHNRALNGRRPTPSR